MFTKPLIRHHQFIIMKLFGAKILLRILGFFFVLGFSSYLVAKLCLVTKEMEQRDIKSFQVLKQKTISEVENSAGFFIPLTNSASSLATSLSRSLNGTELSYDVLQSKAAPNLFLVLSTIPYVTYVSIDSTDGLVYSYNNYNNNQIFAYFINNTNVKTWYHQPVSPDTGKRYGVATLGDSNATYSSWANNASLNSTYENGTLVQAWFDQNIELFLNRASMDGRGTISLGLPKDVVVKRFKEVEFNDAIFFLATDSGIVIFQNKELPGAVIGVDNGILFLKDDGHSGLEEMYSNVSCTGNQDWNNSDDKQNSGKSFEMSIKGMAYKFQCSMVPIAGQNCVYVVAFPNDALPSLNTGKFVITLLGLMFACTVVSLFICMFFSAKSAKREMFLRNALVKQMKATQQAEQKSMNKSLAFARASHDIRNSLATITGLIEECHEYVTTTDLKAKLVNMDNWSKDLLGILRSVLDMSKIDSGKMKLEEEEFNLSQLLLDVVDMYHYDAIKKGVDVVLDPCDGSIFKVVSVKGDRLRVKQILCNLISNAVKFTSKGHVAVRAWVMRRNSEDVLVAANQNGFMGWLSRICYKIDGKLADLELQSIKQSAEYLQFVFEVDDTGKGIPKCQQSSVFENFVQVEVTDPGKEGTGLGLGIVQSLVRLMGGEIGIVDKETGKGGTCFKFNIFLAAQGEGHCIMRSSGFPTTDTHTLSSFHILPRTSRSEVSHVVLCIPSGERRRIIRKFIENFGIQVSVVNQGRELDSLIKLNIVPSSSFNKNETRSVDYKELISSNSARIERCSSTRDKTDHTLSYHRWHSNSRSSSFILVVVSAHAEDHTELSKTLNHLKRNIPSSLFKIVCLDRGHDDIKTSIPCDYVISNPLHGERIIEVLKILPEFGGTADGYDMLQGILVETKTQKMQQSVETHGLKEFISLKTTTESSSSNSFSVVENVRREQSEVKERHMSLEGMNILVAEDSPVILRTTLLMLRKYGANVESVVNGKQALDRVRQIMRERFVDGKSESQLFDLVILDGQMPVMDGFEAARQIRIEEKQYGLHVPIIALTGDELTIEVGERITNAGMDFHLEKPLNNSKVNKILESIQGLEASETPN